MHSSQIIGRQLPFLSFSVPLGLVGAVQDAGNHAHRIGKQPIPRRGAHFAATQPRVALRANALPKGKRRAQGFAASQIRKGSLQTQRLC